MMKKAMLVLFAAAALVACNDSSSDPVKKAIDSTEERGDSLKQMADSSMDRKIDSLEERKEALIEKTDSMTEARKDSLKKIK